MDSSDIQTVVQELSDLELATLLCFITDQHCIIQAPESLLQDVRREIEILSHRLFGLTCASVTCTPDITLDEFSESVVIGDAIDSDDENIDAVDGEYSRNILDNRKVAHVVVAVSLEQAHRNVQIQALELMRSKRIYTRSAIHTAPKRFLLVSLVSNTAAGPPFYTHHLNDYFFLLHRHEASDGFPNIEAENAKMDTQSISSQSSVIVRPSASQRRDFSGANTSCLISRAYVTNIKQKVGMVRTTAEMRRYIHNIVTFLRLHRGVAGGISALSTRHLNLLCRALAPLHGIDFVTPSLVALAARKIYTHRIEVATAITERSRQWDSDPDAVTWALKGATPAVIVDEVLTEVEVPL